MSLSRCHYESEMVALSRFYLWRGHHDQAVYFMAAASLTQKASAALHALRVCSGGQLAFKNLCNRLRA